jgi:hypothetical protein
MDGPLILLVNSANRVEAVTACDIEANHMDIGIPYNFIL